MKERVSRLLTALLLISVLLSACTPSGGEVVQSAFQRNDNPLAPPDDLDQLVTGNTTFAFDLYQALLPSNENIFLSPYSISLALAMAYAGARGDTATQMAATMSFTLPDEQIHQALNALDLDLAQRPQQAADVEKDQRFELNIVNSMWSQKDWPFLPEFLDLLALNYGAGMRLVDFVSAPEDARRTINDWVSHETKKRIQDLLPPGVIDTLTRLVLVNAIYFKATWEHQFAASLTEEAPFTLVDNSQVDVPMMAMQDPIQLAYAGGEGWQTVALPYKGGLAEMIIILPDLGEFETFEASLGAMQLTEILDSMQSKSVSLTMPKFSFTSQYSLPDVLAEMGMPDAFDPDLADFSAIDGQRDLYISEVIHKAFVSVDEAGTEAAAATGVVFFLSAAPMYDVELRIDRPFIFLIRDVPTGSVLFIGRVLQP